MRSGAAAKARLIVEELEPRILYSADAATLAHPGALSGAVETRLLTDSAPHAMPAGAAAAESAVETQPQRREIVFIDTGISGYEQLLADLHGDTGRDIETVLLEADGDGVSQISSVLARREDIAAVHVVSHGFEGRIQLGADTLDAASVESYAAQIRGWSAALTADADILFYGCDVAADAQGQALIDTLGFLTGADVAASFDLTGNAARGGDWDLEYRRGAVESAVVGGAMAWDGTLLVTPAGAETQVTATGDIEHEASIAMDASGNYAIAYSSDLGGSSYGVRMMRFDAAGNAVGGEILLNVFTPGDQRYPSVGMDAAGNIVVAWSSDTQDGAGLGIFVRRYDSAGVAQGAETQVNSTAAGGQDRPSVAVDGSGNYVITWTSDQNGDLDVFGRRFAADGTALGAEFLVNAGDTANNQDQSAVAMDSAGNFVVTWRTSTTLDGSGSAIYAQRYDSTGAAVGAAFQVNTTGTGNQSDPSVALSAAGFVVSWTSTGQDGSGDGVFAQRYNAAGVAQGTELQVNTTTANAQDSSAVSIDTAGRFTIVWSSDLQDGSGRGVYGQAYDANGVRFGAEFQVNTTTANAQELPAVVMRAGTGDFVVAWSGEGPTDAAGVAFQRYQRINTAPTISDTTDQTTNEDTATGAIAFTIGDAETAAGSLTVQAVSSNQAVVADGNIVLGGSGTNRTITLTPTANASGTATITITVSDSALQANDTFVLTVNSANDAPTLTNGASFALTATNENTTSSATGVDAILTGAAGADIDAAALRGIAVTSKTGGGSWQYSTDGVTWNAFGAVSATNALLLTSTSQVRYLPNGLNGETATFGFRAWDQTTGTASTNATPAYANPGAGGGTTAYSTGSATASMTVTPVNDAPTVTARALSFDGSDLVVVPPQPNLEMTSTMTMEVTFQRTGALGPTNQIILNKEGEYELALSSTGQLRWAFANTTPGWAWVDTSFTVPADTWIHVSVTYNNGVVSTYVDGTLVDTFNGTGTIGDAHPALDNFTIGGRQNSAVERFSGLIDEVRIWNIERTGAQIQGDYASALAGNEAGLVGYWRFNESSGTTAVDSSTQGYNGVLGNGVPADVPTRTTNIDYTTAEDNALVVGAAGVLTTATDPEGSVLTVSLVSGPSNAAAFTLNPNGSFSYTPLADFNGTDTFVFTASDGSLTSQQATVTITVTPANDPPVITSNGGGASAGVSIAENTTAVTTVTATDIDLPVQTLTYSIVGGADQALFTIDANTGALAFLTARDFETPADAGANNIYDVTVQASDGAGGTDTQAIAVTITAVNDNSPVITSNGGGASGSVSIAENTTAVTTVVATDADLPAQTLTYSIVGGADQALFTIDANSGALSFTTARNFENPTDAGANNIYDVTVQASDGTFADTQAIAVTVTAVNDNTPVITSNGGGASASVSIAENTTAVTTVAATDADLPAQTLTYSIVGGADQALFTIDVNSGALSFTTARDFENPTDAGANNIYDVTVQASDGTFTDTQAIAVTITAVNDSTPVITSNGGGASAAASIAENTTAVTTVVATDADVPAQTLTYSIVGGADQALFTIDANSGALSFVTARDFESPADAGANNIYDVTVQASDGTFTDTQAIAVTVTAVNDNGPVITSNGGGASAGVSIAENTTAVTTVVATDADLPAQTLTYSIVGGADQALFTIDANTGALSFATARNFEAPADAGANNVYDVTVQASDGAGGTDTQAIAVTITPVDDNTPVITSNGGGASASVNVAENTTAVTTVVATDADLPAQTLSYSISGGADAALFAIDANTGALTFLVAPDFEAPTDAGANNVYDVIVQAADGAGGLDAQAIAVTVTAANEPPAITSDGGGAVAAISVAENSTAVTIVSAADPDLPVQTVTYSIVGGADQALFTIDANSGALSFIAPRNFEAPTDAGANNVYDVTVQASDGAGGTDTQAIAVTITSVNDNTPAITSNGGGASAAVSIAENATAVTTVVATDADLPAQTLTYSIVGGADQALFTIDANTGALAFLAGRDFEAPADAGADNVYDVTVQASDGTFSDTQAIAVTVTALNDNNPVITSNGGGAAAALAVAENTAAVTTVSASDADVPAQPLIYSIIGGADQALFAIDANSGALSFIAARDFEAPADAGADNVYDVTVQASDGAGGTDTQAIAVTITSVNDNTPAITSNGGGASAAVSIAENATAVTTVVATDADLPAQTLTYSIVGGADQAFFTIDANTGALSFTAARDFENPNDAGANNIYDVTVQASDGTFSDTQAIAVTITAINDNNPVITSNGGGASAAVSIAENTTAVTTVVATDADLPAQSMTYSIAGGADQALFTIDASTGALSFITARNFEAPADAGANNIYDVTVQASDGAGGTDTQAIAVTIAPVNDNAPVITSNGGGASAALSIAENASAVTTVAATDADQPVQTLTYSIVGGADQALFTIDANTGALAFLAGRDFEAPADADADNVYDVTVQASDGAFSDTQAIAVTVTPVNDSNPIITSNGGGASAAVSVAENATAATTVTATDADLPAQAMTYTIIGGADQAFFTIDAITGVLGFIAARDFEAPADAGADNVYDVTVQAADGAGGLDTQAIAVTVTPVNDNTPAIGAGQSFGTPENSANGTVVGSVTASDADAGTTFSEWTIAGGNTGGAFSIDAATGQLAVANIAALDFESNPVFTLALTVSDGTLTSAVRNVTIALSNVNEAPTVQNAVADQATLEDAPFTFTFAANTFADVDVPDALTYTTNALPSWLTFNGATRTFSGTPGDFDVGSVTVSLTATDNGLAVATDTFDVVVTNVNDPPAGADALLTTAEDTAYTFAPADFGFSDASDSPANALAAVRIDTLPLDGQLTLASTTVTAGQFITMADIAAGSLRFTPEANANGEPYASFTFQVQDDGGTVNGGTNIDATPATLTLNVTAVADPPPFIPPPPDAPPVQTTTSGGSVPGVVTLNTTPARAAGGAAASTAFGATGGAAGEGAVAGSATGIDADSAIGAGASSSTSSTAASSSADAILTGTALLADAGSPVATLSSSPAQARETPTLRRDGVSTPSLTSEILRMIESTAAGGDDVRTVLLARDLPSGIRAAPSGRGAQNSGDSQGESTSTLLTFENGVKLTGVVISAGAVTWALQGAGLLASLVGSVPAWRHLDPLPVLAPEEEKPSWQDDKDREAQREEDAASALWADSETPA